MVNPYNGKTRRVSLLPRDVDGIVLWTKNIGPLIGSLPEISAMGHTFYVQYGVGGYPRELEPSVVSADKAIGHIEALAGRWGPRCVVWRYDPILLTVLTPEAWHVENFSRLAARMRGLVDEVVVSFAQFYRKTRQNLAAAATRHGFAFTDPPHTDRMRLLAHLVDVARAEGIQLTVFTQPANIPAGAKPARCIDAARLSDLCGMPIKSATKGNRPGCECAQSVDIGDYDTCPHGCAYCYAVRDRDVARGRHRGHDPNGEFLRPGFCSVPADREGERDLFGLRAD